MGEWVRRVARPAWVSTSDAWPRNGHRAGMPVRGYPLRTQRPIALIGEGPGKDESTYGYPFIGASGQEVDRHLERVGLSRDLCFVSNYTWQVPDSKGKLGSLNPHLLAELREADPEIVMTLGRYSTRCFLGDVDMEAVHGIPHRYRNAETGLAFTVLPGYHPAAGMHQVELSAHVAYDFDMLAGTLRGEVPIRDGPADQWPEPDYYDVTDANATQLAMQNDDLPAEPWTADGVAIDTEGSVSRPWGLSYASRPGEAFVLRAAAAETQIQIFGKALRWGTRHIQGFRVWLHNSMHDLPVLQALGIDLVEWGIPFIDTMVLAYHLCIEPQGLKPSALRHCGMTMNSYLDLVGPYTHQRAIEYLVAVGCDDSLPRRGQYVDFEVKNRVMTPKVHTPTHIAKRAAKILGDVAADKRNKDDEPVDPYKRWYQIDAEDRAIAEAKYGELEAATLDDVPLDIAVRYAARDADATRRLGPILLARHEAVFGRAA